MPRRPGASLAAVALVASSLLLGGTGIGADAAPSGGPAIRADLDGNRLFDDLEARLAGMGDADSVDVIVTLAGAGTDARIDGLMREVGGFGVTHRWTIIDGFAATVTKGQALALARLPAVRSVEENGTVQAFNETAQASFGVTQARVDANVDGNVDGVATYSKMDMVVAVIDTGCDIGHFDLDEGKVIAFKDFVGTQTTSYDDNGHGSHVAGTIAGDGEGRTDGRYKGVAPGAALVCAKVLNSVGSGTFAAVISAINWVIDLKVIHGYNIVALNLSLGANGCNNGTDAPSAAVNSAATNGIVPAVAAGNAGPAQCSVGTPGAAANALTVGAMSDMGVLGFKQAYFSSRGKTSDGRIKPDISAPGVSITSVDNGTTNGYIVFSGTSMATPFVAGVAALMREANPLLSAARIKSTIMSTAVDWGRGPNNTAGTTGADPEYGAGRLDAYAAIEAAKGSDIGTGPAMPAHERKDGTLSGTGVQVDYQLNVTSTQFPIAATLIMPAITGATASSPDFDLYLFNPGMTQVAAALTTRRQDELGYAPPATGTYTLRVKSYSGSGDFFVDISAGTAPPPAGISAPTISSVSPTAGATGVTRATNVSATFSEPMDQASAQDAFSILPSVAGAFSWSGNTMTFNPSADLAATTTYTATVSTAAKDAAGNALAPVVTWSFTTSAAATVTAFPSSVVVVTGTFRGGGASLLDADDIAYYEVNSTSTGNRTTAWYGSFGAVPNGLANLTVSYVGKNSRTCTQTVAIWRWTDSTWVQLDSRSVGTAEVAIQNLAPGGTLADYVSGTSGDGDLRVRIRCRTTSGTFFSSGDLMPIVYNTP